MDNKKLKELKEKIENKEKELLNEINHSLANRDESAYNHLKQLQLQCRAELRLIKYIEDGLEGDFMIC